MPGKKKGAAAAPPAGAVAVPQRPPAATGTDPEGEQWVTLKKKKPEERKIKLCYKPPSGGGRKELDTMIEAKHVKWTHQLRKQCERFGHVQICWHDFCFGGCALDGCSHAHAASSASRTAVMKALGLKHGTETRKVRLTAGKHWAAEVPLEWLLPFTGKTQAVWCAKDRVARCDESLRQKCVFAHVVPEKRDALIRALRKGCPDVPWPDVRATVSVAAGLSKATDLARQHGRVLRAHLVAEGKTLIELATPQEAQEMLRRCPGVQASYGPIHVHDNTPEYLDAAGPGAPAPPPSKCAAPKTKGDAPQPKPVVVHKAAPWGSKEGPAQATPPPEWALKAGEVSAAGTESSKRGSERAPATPESLPTSVSKPVPKPSPKPASASADPASGAARAELDSARKHPAPQAPAVEPPPEPESAAPEPPARAAKSAEKAQQRPVEHLQGALRGEPTVLQEKGQGPGQGAQEPYEQPKAEQRRQEAMRSGASCFVAEWLAELGGGSPRSAPQQGAPPSEPDPEQLRVDEADGCAYNYQEYCDQYGEDALRRWKESRVVDPENVVPNQEDNAAGAARPQQQPPAAQQSPAPPLPRSDAPFRAPETPSGAPVTPGVREMGAFLAKYFRGREIEPERTAELVQAFEDAGCTATEDVITIIKLGKAEMQVTLNAELSGRQRRPLRFMETRKIMAMHPSADR
eukprot:TRINITY_DN56303_c0_g1_i1.p1 TRINITY_DN56303_c0_g1~~TRINITY_DN56303_c0_g1_i1.p1  ORF type:complete len:689 (+),score=215.08 TRINITY_DN56303_c0_g1_i1:99-2165(+)